ncbi:MAG: hypothetical protein ACRDOI_04160 [Trebonia sp.]
MPVVIVLAVIVVLAVVVFLAMGRGGELSAERMDYAPLDLGPVSATDIALLRPPTGVWGYNMDATDEAMDQIAESIRERDVRIVALEQLVTDLSRDHAPMPLLASPYAGARHRRSRADTAEPEAVQPPWNTPVAGPAVQQPRDSAEPEPEPEMETATATETVQLPWGAGLTESVRLPFDQPRPSGEVSAQPPERSHD